MQVNISRGKNILEVLKYGHSDDKFYFKIHK